MFKVGLSPANTYSFNPTYALLIGNIPGNVWNYSFGLRFYNNNIGLNGVIALNGGAQIQGPNQNYPVITGVNISNTFKGNNVAVAAGATSLAVTLSQNLNTTNYAVYVTPQWNTTVWITGKTTTGFTINFGTAAPTGGSALDWVIFF